MQKIMLSGMVALSMVSSAVQAAPVVKKGLPVVSGATALTATEKASVDGMHCGCDGGGTPEAPRDSKPGYGFGTTGHYGPPGQGFTPEDSWRGRVNGNGKTPKGNDLPPRAFTTPTRFLFD